MSPQAIHRSARLILAALAAFSAGAAGAADLQCNGRWVSIGATKAQVFAQCGEPVFKDSYCDVQADNPAKAGTSAQTTVIPCLTVDAWTYNPGSGHFMTTVKFKQGALTSIEYGERVP